MADTDYTEKNNAQGFSAEELDLGQNSGLDDGGEFQPSRGANIGGEGPDEDDESGDTALALYKAGKIKTGTLKKRLRTFAQEFWDSLQYCVVDLERIAQQGEQLFSKEAVKILNQYKAALFDLVVESLNCDIYSYAATKDEQATSSIKQAYLSIERLRKTLSEMSKLPEETRELYCAALFHGLDYAGRPGGGYEKIITNPESANGHKRIFYAQMLNYYDLNKQGPYILFNVFQGGNGHFNKTRFWDGKLDAIVQKAQGIDNYYDFIMVLLRGLAYEASLVFHNVNTKDFSMFDVTLDGEEEADSGVVSGDMPVEDEEQEPPEIQEPEDAEYDEGKKAQNIVQRRFDFLTDMLSGEKNVVGVGRVFGAQDDFFKMVGSNFNKNGEKE